MSLELTETQEMIRDTVRQFAIEVVEPRAAEIDREAKWSQENFDGMAEIGLLALPLPEEYGGAGADFLCYCLIADIRDKFFPKDGPSSVICEVSALAWPEFMIEIEAVAVVG